MLTSFGFGHSGLFCLGFLYINRHYLCSTTCFDAIQGADGTSDKGIYQYGAWAWCSCIGCYNYSNAICIVLLPP
ncbi:hypothetical protein BFJ70_g771 [Fusarium oxysporum]|uniref:Uncharacterized protein n=1 Tax=Fusarium oxysporum TaxID=5507 RepID=A0A420Q8Y4_FUSOX|nr:hypothetical protein BFJ71_g5441 [Fusarium oxysporum]RKL16193.1 hypothetical protein BFJ68_g5444 [Fusarium oxysporum]RKL52055.1 hypothetical protein BFJ70_g771 [Fusarium oxysporum]